MKRYYLTGSLFFIFILQLSAQDAVLKAMNDELKRNMKELSLEGYDDPFFIGYGVSQVKTLAISALMGGVLRSSLDSSRSWDTRVMVGSYAVNDENYNDPKTSFEQESGYEGMPLDDNYQGIRRSFWISTNNIYKAASKLHKSKSELYAKLGIDSLPLKDFSKAEVVKRNMRQEITLPDQHKTELAVADLSEKLMDKRFMRSHIWYQQTGANYYFVNSEGTEVVIPQKMGYLVASIQLLDNEQSLFNQNITYLFQDTLDYEMILKDLKKVKGFIRQTIEQEKFEEIYYGPVLIEGGLVGEFLLSNLYSGSQTIIAKRSDLSNNDKELVNVYINNLEKEISRPPQKIASNELTITATPHIKKYHKKPLYGSFSIDAEGVIPPDSLVLIRDGRMVAQLNGRTPAPLAKRSNGHNRINLNFGGTYKSVSPGVLTISAKNPVPSKELKQKLIEKARQKGLEYALIIRPLEIEADLSTLFRAFKVDVNTGKETPVRMDYLNLASNNSLFRLVAMSDENMACTKMWGSGTQGGIPVSLIMPQSILVEAFEYNNTSRQYNNSARYAPTVPSPLEE